ncbi:acyltransferase family protein [uncultured Methylovirgula sp.]|uniref:acyltransferase family protein n=1 Tax=uncultured Methylovirgula sp. TaxID=1285960 RepID=UPI0026226B09|nr:acyltransferase family protein [uncultured Methylovirgula sp.]
MNDAKRIDWIDAAKGIGIIAVVVGHVVEPTGYLARTLYSFHMPLFFVISGYLFNFEKNDADLPKTIKTKFHHLMIPYFVCGVSVFSIWLLFSCPKPFVATPGGAIAALASQSLVSYLYGIGQINVLASLAWITPVGTAWFLAALFCTEILFLFFLKALRRAPAGIRLCAAISMALLGVLIGRKIFLPWSLDISFVALLFVLVGYELKQHDYVARATVWHALGAGVVWFGCMSFSMLSMNNRQYDNFPLAMTGAVAGSFAVLYVAKTVSRFVPAMASVGKRSLVIMLAHPVLFYYLPAGSPIRYHWSWESVYLLAASLATSVVIEAIILSLAKPIWSAARRGAREHAAARTERLQASL